METSRRGSLSLEVLFFGYGERCSLAERRPSDASAHLQLAWALLNEAEPRPARVQEAALQARWALALDPTSAAALVSLGRVSLLEGRRDEGFARWSEADALDTAVTEGLLARLAQRYPQEVESFRLRAAGGEGGGDDGGDDG